MRKAALHIIITTCFVSLLPARHAYAAVSGGTKFVLDLTKPSEFAKKAIWHSPSKNVKLSEKGLTLDAADNARADVWIQITGPIGVGTYWRPARSVHIRAQVDPPTGIGELFVRSSADALHWSDWQCVGMEVAKDQNEPKQQYSGRLSIPRRQRQRYERLFEEYRKLDVPWIDDQEAAVEWILRSDPNFFEKPAPFIGYVQFLYETELAGGRSIRTLTFYCTWILNGMHTLPKNDPGYMPPWDIPWSFKAPELQDKKARTKQQQRES